MSSNGPLTGITVIDLTRALAGPFSTLLLAGLGARVIKIEQPGQGDGRSTTPFIGKDGAKLRRESADDISMAHLIRSRGKQSITLDFKHPEAAAIFAKLVSHADVVVENFTRGTADRLGVGYKQAAAAKPNIVYCSISGFGDEGGSGGRAVDGLIQALSGNMMTSGMEGEAPVRVGMPIADLGTPLFATIGILAALYHRAITGEGQRVDTSMLGALTALQAIEPFQLLADLGIPTRTGTSVPRLAPFNTYPARDGYVVICNPGPGLKAVAAGIGMPELADDPRFSAPADRLHNYQKLDEIIGAWMAEHNADEAVAKLQAAGATCGRVRTPGEATQDERVLRRGEVVPLEHPKYGSFEGVVGPGLPIVFSRTRAQYSKQTVDLGENNAEIYGGLLGYSEEDLARLRKEGAI